jgi:negative regulator of sigma E activity
MNTTDETLSAFLDNELTDADMEAVRDQLAADPSLADRLAKLATVDAELQAHYSSIDDRPMPESVTRMLKEAPSRNAAPRKDNVVSFHWWRTMQWRGSMRGHAGKAAAAAVIAGVALMQWFDLPLNGDPAWPAVTQVLDSQPSGEDYQVNNQATLMPRLTFRNQAGEWCRQFRLESADAASEQIACRSKAGGWEQVARAEVEPSSESGNYQTASGGNVLDETLERIMANSPIGPEKESALLEQLWRE